VRGLYRHEDKKGCRLFDIFVWIFIYSGFGFVVEPEALLSVIKASINTSSS
jgi:hypothetical protein